MRTTSTILASLLGIGLLGCAAAEESGTPPEPIDPSEPAPEPVEPPADDPAYSAKIEQSEYSLELVVRTMREVDDYELTTAGGDVDLMWREYLVIEGGDYDIYELRLAFDPLDTIEILAFHEGNIDIVTKDSLGFEIGSSSFQLKMTTPGQSEHWSSSDLDVGAGPSGFAGTMYLKPAASPQNQPTASVYAEGDSYPVVLEKSSDGYIARWDHYTMAMCIIAMDCSLRLVADDVVSSIKMGISAPVQTVVGPR